MKCVLITDRLWIKSALLHILAFQWVPLWSSLILFPNLINNRHVTLTHSQGFLPYSVALLRYHCLFHSAADRPQSGIKQTLNVLWTHFRRMPAKVAAFPSLSRLLRLQRQVKEAVWQRQQSVGFQAFLWHYIIGGTHSGSGWGEDKAERSLCVYLSVGWRDEWKKGESEGTEDMKMDNFYTCRH